MFKWLPIYRWPPKVSGEALESSLNAEMARLRLESELAQKERDKLQISLHTLTAEVMQLKDELESVHRREQDAIEEMEFTLLQLYEVQEELEHYFLQSYSSGQLAAVQQQQLLRAQALMARFLPEATALAPAQRVAVEVLPPPPPAAVQTEALLSSYATILRRASALLQRAIQR